MEKKNKMKTKRKKKTMQWPEERGLTQSAVLPVSPGVQGPFRGDRCTMLVATGHLPHHDSKQRPYQLGSLLRHSVSVTQFTTLTCTRGEQDNV